MQRMSNQFVWSCMLQSDSLIQNRALLCMQYSFERVQCPFVNVWYMLWNVPFNMKQPSIARSAILIEKINPLTAGCPVAFFETVVAYLHARFSYKRGHIPLRKFFMILKHNPEMCTAFLQKEGVMSSMYLCQMQHSFHLGRDMQHRSKHHPVVEHGATGQN